MTKKKNISKKKNNSYLRLVILLILILIIVSSFIYIIYYNYIVLDYKEVYADVSIGRSLGMSADNDALWFGIITPGSKSKKEVYISFPEKVIVKTKCEGNISTLIEVNKNNFILEPNITETLEFTVSAPEDAEYGKYNGTVKIYFLRPSLFS